MRPDPRLLGFTLAALACGESQDAASLQAIAPSCRAGFENAFREMLKLPHATRRAQVVEMIRAIAASPRIRPIVASEIPPDLARALRSVADDDPTDEEVAMLVDSPWPA